MFQLVIVFVVVRTQFALLTIILLNASVLQVHMLVIRMILKKVANKFLAFIITTVPQHNFVTDWTIHAMTLAVLTNVEIMQFVLLKITKQLVSVL